MKGASPGRGALSSDGRREAAGRAGPRFPDGGAEILARFEARSAAAGPVRLGVDTGGTFTDFVLVEDGRLTTWKSPSAPADPGRPVREALGRVAGGVVRLGTTVGTNALLEGRGARVALVTTAGFEDLPDLGRQTRPELYALCQRQPPPLVPRDLRFGVRERVAASGDVVSAPDTAEVEAMARRLRGLNVEAVAVVFLHSYARDDHERVVGAILRRELPGLPVSLSSEVLREYREFERLSATCINAFTAPLMERYLSGLGLDGRPLAVSVSSGGVVPGEIVSRFPVKTLLSGPAAGVVGALEVARRHRCGPLITLDMGGTSTDVAWVDPERHELPVTTSGSVGGWPVALPSVDLETLGAGGGSLARLDAAGALVVGPESAGADPGPAACGRGTQATVTDAALILGLLPAEIPLAAGVRLDRSAAEAAVARLAAPLGAAVLDVARAIVEGALAHMERGVRRVSSARGRDPATASLFAFGGAGGLFAAELAARLGIRRVLIPPGPGVFSAWGTLTAPLRHDWSQSVRIPAAQLDGRPPLEPFHDRLGRFAAARPGEPGIHASFGVRYAGQSHDLPVPADADWEARFHEAHQALAGFRRPAERPWIATLRLTVSQAAVPPPLPASGPAEAAPAAPRPVHFPRGDSRMTAVADRAGLNGLPHRGPVILVERGAATVVPPGWRWTTGPAGLLVLEPEEAP